ncbi:MAG: FAD-dependent monooxygenase [Pseudomonadota bacterium]
MDELELRDTVVSEARHTIIISGGGLVGLSVALLLAEGLPPSVRIHVLESRGRAPANDRESCAGNFDARSTALSYSTYQIYEQINVWRKLAPLLAPIKSIHVSRRNRFGSSQLHAVDQGWDALGWVAENELLADVLLDAVQAKDQISVSFGVKISSVEPTATGFSVTTTCSDGEPMAGHPRSEQTVRSDGPSASANGTKASKQSVDLLIVAEGAGSELRSRLGIDSRRTSYRQHALIANLSFRGTQQSIAFERFTADGPLALLPLPSSGNESRMALVWTLPQDKAAQLQHASHEAFSSALVQEFGHRLGSPTHLGERSVFPLSLVESKEQVRRGCVILGNAAHSLHPVAGQGFNLSMRDAAALVAYVKQGVEIGSGPGDLTYLSAYATARLDDQVQTIQASDQLPELFMRSDPVLSIARDLALAGLDLIPQARRHFIREAAGNAALER